MEKRSNLTKNVISLLLFVFVYYAVTNNSIVKPLTIPELGEWSIEKAQSPILFGLFSHNYLLLRNDKGVVEEELQGTPTDDGGVFVRTALTSGKTLRVLRFENPPYGDKNYRPSAVTVFSGDKDSVYKKWKEGITCANKINEKKLPYPAFGINMEEDTVNSNSVATTLLTCMILPSPRVGLLTPGDNNIITR